MSGPPPTSLGLEATPRLRGPACRASSPRALAATDFLVGPSALRRPPSTRMVLSLAVLTQEQVPGVFQGPCFPRWVLCLRGRHPSSPDIQGYQASCPGDWLGQASHFPAGPGRSPRGRLSAEQLQAPLLRGGAAGAPGPVAAGRAGGAQQPAEVCAGDVGLPLERLASASIPGATGRPEIARSVGPPLSPLWGTGGGGVPAAQQPLRAPRKVPAPLLSPGTPGISRPRLQSSRGRSVGPCLKNKTEGSPFLPLQGQGHSKSKGQGSWRTPEPQGHRGVGGCRELPGAWRTSSRPEKPGGSRERSPPPPASPLGPAGCQCGAGRARPGWLREAEARSDDDTFAE